MSTMGSYLEYLSTVGGYREYRGGTQITKDFSPTVLNTPTVLHTRHTGCLVFKGQK